MNSLAIMILFLTRIPLPYKVNYNEDELAKGIKYMPFVGLLIGGILYGTAIALDKLGFDRGIITAIAWTIYLIVTGGLHIDGLADTLDGIYSNRDKKRVLEIMKDSNIGTFGVLGIIVVLGISVISSYYLDYIIYLVFPIASRSVALIICAINRYAREDGMGKVFVDRCGKKELFVGLVVGLLSSALFLGASGSIAFVIVTAITILAVRNTAKVIDGITGDIIGFTIEISQMIFLTGIYTVLKIMDILS